MPQGTKPRNHDLKYMSSFKLFLSLILSAVVVVAFLWDMVSGGEVLRKKDLFMFTASEVSVPHVRKHEAEEGVSHVEVKK